MQNISVEIKQAPLSSYNTANQFHGGQNWAWQSCRETFHHHYTGKSHGLFYGTNKIEAVATMFDWVENILNICKDHRSIIHPCSPIQSGTVQYSAIWVQLAPFWLSMKVRTYFVTMMLRATHFFNENRSPLAALMNLQYCKNSRSATAAFLGGYTIAYSLRERSNVYRQWQQLVDRVISVNMHELVIDDVYYAYKRGWVVRFGDVESTRSPIGLRLPSTGRQRIWFEDRDPTSRLTSIQKKQLEEWVQALQAEVNGKKRYQKFTFAGLKP